MVENPLVDCGIVPQGFINSWALNMYHDGSEGIQSHFDDAQRFCQPIYSMRHLPFLPASVCMKIGRLLQDLLGFEIVVWNAALWLYEWRFLCADATRLHHHHAR